MVVNSESGWMHSPGHRANILRDAFTHTAVGIAQHESDLWATQLFAQKRGELFGEVPGIARVDDCLLVEMTPYPPDAPDALGFELLRLSDEQAVGSPTPLGMSRLDVPAGRYRLRFHLPLSARRHSIVSGPSLEVQ
jgi:hypothetical protein